MASPVCLILLLHCDWIRLSEAAGRTTVEVTSLSHPVTVGGILAISCEIWNMQEGYTVNIFREFDGNTEQITMDQTYAPSLLMQRVFVSKRMSSDGSAVYFMTVVDVTAQDKGEYVCSVYSLKNKRLTEIATGALIIEIFDFPLNVNPICQYIPNAMQVNEGTELRFICTSEKSKPLVELRWSSNNEDIPSVMDNVNNENTISSEITVVTKRSHNGATFVCTMTSSGFPERQRSCFIGPITIVNSHTKREHMIPRDQDVKVSPGRNSNQDYDSLLSSECDSSCTSDDARTVIFLAAGTMGATILMVTFFITTIILCCKYCEASGEVKASKRSVPCGDGSEPVYVSLQRRPEPDRSSMYMSVEDPNNPGSKVLMPREIVEEFYRSLSLKRKK